MRTECASSALLALSARCSVVCVMVMVWDCCCSAGLCLDLRRLAVIIHIVSNANLLLFEVYPCVCREDSLEDKNVGLE